MLELELKRVKQLCASTRELRFETASGKNLDYAPGQFYRFSFEDNEGLFQRSYSLGNLDDLYGCLLYTSPSPRDVEESRMPSSA